MFSDKLPAPLCSGFMNVTLTCPTHRTHQNLHRCIFYFMNWIHWNMTRKVHDAQGELNGFFQCHLFGATPSRVALLSLKHSS